MPKEIPAEYKKLQCFQPIGEDELKALAIKPTENPFNKIYLGMEKNAGDETLLVCYLPNYAPEKPIVKKIPSADLIEKYPDPESLINKFANLIVFGGGTFIEEAMPKNPKESFKPTLRIPLREKVESLVKQTQICMMLATCCKDVKYITNLFRKIFSYERDLSEADADYRIKTIFKGLRNKGEYIEVDKLIDHCEMSTLNNVKKPDEDIFYIRNIAIVHDPKLDDIKNPKSPVYVITPDAKYKFLGEIDVFIKDHDIDYQKIMYFDQDQSPKVEHNWLSPATDYYNPNELREGWLCECLKDNDEGTTPAKLTGKFREEMEETEQRKKRKITPTSSKNEEVISEDEEPTSFQRGFSSILSKH